MTPQRARPALAPAQARRSAETPVGEGRSADIALTREVFTHSDLREWSGLGFDGPKVGTR